MSACVLLLVSCCLNASSDALLSACLVVWFCRMVNALLADVQSLTVLQSVCNLLGSALMCLSI